MKRGNFRCTDNSVGVEAQLSTLATITQVIDPKLHQHIGILLCLFLFMVKQCIQFYCQACSFHVFVLIKWWKIKYYKTLAFGYTFFRQWFIFLTMHILLWSLLNFHSNSIEFVDILLPSISMDVWEIKK